MNADDLANKIDAILAEIRESIGVLPVKQNQHIYETDDERCVLVGMTDYEAELVDLELFGKSRNE